MKLRFWLLLLLVLAAVVYLGPPFMAFNRARGVIPAGMTLGGAVITASTPDEAVAQLRQIFESPVLVYHGQRRLVLRAEQIGFRIEAEAMVAEAQRYQRGLYTLREFLFYLLERPPIGRDIPLRYRFDRDKLAAWLREQAAVYDNDPTPAYAKLDTLQFVPGQPGRYTDLADSAVRIIAAFSSAHNRQAHLVLHEQPPLPPTPETLEDALRRRLERFNGIYSLYYEDLTTGEVIDIDGDTAFAGMSTVKIPILLKLYHDYDLPLDPATTRWISETVTSETASNAGANALLYRIGDGDTLTGARRVTEFVRQLGYQNTFIAVPYDSDLTPPRIVTPANANPEYNTYPDPAMQTTPTDIGRILADIGRCAEGRGNILAAFPDRLNPAKCQDLIGWLERNPMGYLLRYGVPKEARVAHKHGYGTDTQGDVALIYGPAGPYVLAVFVYQYGWVVWDQSNPLMNDLSRLVWNYYLARLGREQLPPFERTASGNRGN